MMERRAFLGAAAVATGAVLPGTDSGEKNVHDVHNSSAPETSERDSATTPVHDAFGHFYAETDAEESVTVNVTADEVWDGHESYRVAYTEIKAGPFRFTIHLEGDDARAVAHDLLAAVDDTDE